MYLELWIYKQMETNKDRKFMLKIMKFLFVDLESKIAFIEEYVQNKDFKPFFTNMWDSVILTNKHGMLSFGIFGKLQATYSWMKYSNTELESARCRQQSEHELVELLGEVRQSIEEVLKTLRETQDNTLVR